jgi:hypothetical protein
MKLEEQGKLLHSALFEAEGFAALGMWEDAWLAIEGLPDSLRVHPYVLARSVSVLARMDWDRAMRLSDSMTFLLPERADTWFRMACVCAELGDATSATLALQRCMAFHSEWRTRNAVEGRDLR